MERKRETHNLMTIVQHESNKDKEVYKDTGTDW